MLAALAVAVVAGAALWRTLAPGDTAPPPVAAAIPVAATREPPVVDAGARTATPSTDVARTVRAEAPPEGMTAEQWRALQDALKDDPNRQAEIARVTGYMGFLSRSARWRALREQGAAESPQALALARGLLDELPGHVARGETSGAEARVMVHAWVDTLYPNDTERGTQRDLQIARVAAALPATPDASAAAAADARYQQAQAALVAQWSAKPAAQRDEAQLEAALDALRRDTYPAPATGGKQP
ncbi:MAG: hypothetical protein JSR59_25640 [Proteobacteria bacterium]|nr:hypothetical protein [Pseudomonadota bacterium]